MKTFFQLFVQDSITFEAFFYGLNKPYTFIVNKFSFFENLAKEVEECKNASNEFFVFFLGREITK